MLYENILHIHDYDLSETPAELVVLWLEVVAVAEIIHAATGLVPGI